MSRVRLTIFTEMVKKANPQFKEAGSCLAPLLAQMRTQGASNNFLSFVLEESIRTARQDKDAAMYEAALQYVERAWGKVEIEYKGQSQGTFTIYDEINCPTVLKDASLTFRHIDSGELQSVSFPVCSPSNDFAGLVSVNVQFAKGAYRVKAIVYDLDVLCAFGDSFANRSLSDLGVNERVALGFRTTPAGITAAEIGGLKWEIHGAIPDNADTARQLKGKLQRSGADASAPLADGKACFIAPWATDSGFPGNPRPSARTSVSTLRLVFQGGLHEGTYIETSWTVHTPEARMVPVRNIHLQGKPSAGFLGDIYFDPKNVSFAFIAFKEGRGTVVAKQTGFKAPPVLRLGTPPPQLPRSPSGYFASAAGRVHQQGNNWTPIGAGNAATGSKVDTQDTVCSGANNRWPNKYTAADGAVLNGRDTDVPSEGEWPIFWKYRAVDLAAEVTFQQVKHKAVMDRDGKVTMSKAGASVTKNVADASENLNLLPRVP